MNPKEKENNQKRRSEPQKKKRNTLEKLGCEMNIPKKLSHKRRKYIRKKTNVSTKEGKVLTCIRGKEGKGNVIRKQER